jgi:hypothetical protein
MVKEWLDREITLSTSFYKWYVYSCIKWEYKEANNGSESN